MVPTRILVLSAALLLGCAGPEPVALNPKYRDVDLRGRVVRVLPVFDVTIRNADDFDDDLGADAREPSAHPVPVVTRLFKRPLEKYAEHATLVFDSADDAATAGSAAAGSAAAPMRDTALELPGRKQTVKDSFAYPPPDFFRAKGIEPDLALQFEHLEFRRDIEMTHPYIARHPLGLPGGPVVVGGRVLGRGTRASLELTGRYLLWDYRSNEPVAYGRFSAASFYTVEMSRSNWENVVTQAVRTVVNNSPLKSTK